MATRFHFQDTTVPSISPAFDASWEQTGGADRRVLVRKGTQTVLTALANQAAQTVPITTTQQILSRQYLTEPLPSRVRIEGTFSIILRGLENASTNNAYLAYVLRLLSSDGSIVRGTLASQMSTTGATEWLSTAATRIFSAVAITAITAEQGDRICLEIGGHAQAPAAAGSYTHRYGNNAATDFALTSALTTDLNPWCEFSANLYNYSGEGGNYAGGSTPDGVVAAERRRFW